MTRNISILLCGTLALALGSACSSMEGSAQQQPQSSTMAPPSGDAEHLAAFAASTPYPTDLKSQQAETIGAVVDPVTKVIRIFNFGHSPFTDVNIWLDSTYVYKLDSLPADSYVNTNMSDYYDHSGNSLGSAATTVSQVEVQTPNHLWILLGPIIQGS